MVIIILTNSKDTSAIKDAMAVSGFHADKILSITHDCAVSDYALEEGHEYELRGVDLREGPSLGRYDRDMSIAKDADGMLVVLAEHWRPRWGTAKAGALDCTKASVKSLSGLMYEVKKPVFVARIGIHSVQRINY